MRPDEAKKIEVDLHRELVSICLQDEALVALLASLLGEKSGTGCVLKDLANTLVGLCGTLEILVGTNLLPDLLSLFHDMLAIGDKYGCEQLGDVAPKGILIVPALV